MADGGDGTSGRTPTRTRPNRRLHAGLLSQCPDGVPAFASPQFRQWYVARLCQQLQADAEAGAWERLFSDAAALHDTIAVWLAGMPIFFE